MDDNIQRSNIIHSGEQSNDIQEFFKRPENEDTLHFLKRQHQEQMKRMEELENKNSSPLKMFKNTKIGQKGSSYLNSSPINARNNNPAESNINIGRDTSDSILRQQLRGELPLPSSSSTDFNSRIPSGLAYPAPPSSSMSYMNSRGAPMMSENNNSLNYNNRNDAGLLNEITSLKDMIYRQQTDIQSLKINLNNEKMRNLELFDKLSHLENKLQVIELTNSNTISDRPYTRATSASASSYSDNINYYNDVNNNEFNRSNSGSRSNSYQTRDKYGNNDIQNYKNQEFISSPTVERPFSIVDDKTANLLFSKKRDQ